MLRFDTHPDRYFWEKIEKPDGELGCWIYTGHINCGGYGVLARRFNGGKSVSVLAHRYSYINIIGPIPEGLFLDHLCRNRSCCNPKHLEPVTKKQNTLRGIPGRGMHDHCNKGHKRNRSNMRFWENRDGTILLHCTDCEKEYRNLNKERIEKYQKNYRKFKKKGLV